MASKEGPCLKINNDEVYVQMKVRKMFLVFEVCVFFCGFLNNFVDFVLFLFL